MLNYYVVAGVILLVIVLYIWWVGFFTSINLHNAVLKGSFYVYKQYRGPYDKNLGEEYSELIKLAKNDERVR